MLILREGFDKFYDLVRNPVFYLTKKDPETAHNFFVSSMRFLHIVGLERFVLEFDVPLQDGIKISNAAGSNKSGYLPPSVLKYLGFDRDVLGTITAESYNGRPRPRIKRISESEDLLNWMALPGIGSKEVAKVMKDYGDYSVPVTINFAPTPGKKRKEALYDLVTTIMDTADIPYADRFELNISCPNTGDERAEFQSQLARMLGAVLPFLEDRRQELYLKVSPDLTEEDVISIVKVSNQFPVRGFVTTNTTTNHK